LSQCRLDSRQRKKTHTEKLEQEKKVFTNQKVELEEALAQTENSLLHEREQWHLQRQQYEQFIQQVQYERDEAIRTKTLETAELRRKNNVLMDMVRDLERQQQCGSFPACENFGTGVGDFSNLGLEDNSWHNEFGLIDDDELKMEDHDALQRQATPRPLQPATSAGANTKSDTSFTWNTFYMCLLFGAFVASNSKNTAASSTSAAAKALAPAIPALSDDYRTEAGNVLKAVLASSPESAREIMPTHLHNGMHALPTTITGSEFSRISQQQQHASSLEALHNSLTAPTRAQEAAEAFSLSAEQYNHITNPGCILDDAEGEVDIECRPSRLQQAFASLQAQRDDMERMAGLSGKAAERSVLLERVPEKVLRDFREMIGLSEQLNMHRG